MVLIPIVIGITNGVKVTFDLFLLRTNRFSGGASHDPCSDTYCGEKGFSEIETTQVSQFIAASNGSIVHYINFHSYSQLWMSPWGKFDFHKVLFIEWTRFLGYSTQKPDIFDLQDGGSAKAVDALTAVFGLLTNSLLHWWVIQSL